MLVCLLSALTSSYAFSQDTIWQPDRGTHVIDSASTYRYISADKASGLSDSNAPKIIVTETGSISTTEKRGSTIGHARKASMEIQGGSAQFYALGVGTSAGSNASISITGGGMLTTDEELRIGGGGVGSMTISGPGSTVNSNSDQRVYSSGGNIGASNSGTVTVEKGGTWNTRNLVLGESAGGKGKLLVTGEGSTVNVSAGKGFTTTQGGTGRIDVTDHGKMTLGFLSKVTMNGQMHVSNNGKLEMGKESRLIVHRADPKLFGVDSSTDGLYLKTGGSLTGTGQITGNVYVDEFSRIIGNFQIDNTSPREYGGVSPQEGNGNLYNSGLFETSASTLIGYRTPDSFMPDAGGYYQTATGTLNLLVNSTDDWGLSAVRFDFSEAMGSELNVFLADDIFFDGAYFQLFDWQDSFLGLDWVMDSASFDLSDDWTWAWTYSETAKTLGITLSAINDSSSATPEPATALIFGLGVLGLAAGRRRAGRKNKR